MTWLYDNRISIRQFAKKIGYDRSYIHHWLSGYRKPGKMALYHVAKFTKGNVKSIEDIRRDEPSSLPQTHSPSSLPTAQQPQRNIG